MKAEYLVPRQAGAVRRTKELYYIFSGELALIVPAHVCRAMVLNAHSQPSEAIALVFYLSAWPLIATSPSGRMQALARVFFWLAIAISVEKCGVIGSTRITFAKTDTELQAANIG